MFNKAGLAGAALALMTAFGATAASAEVLVDNINIGDSGDSLAYWGVEDVGWLYTPSTSYDLSGVKTKFSIPLGTSIQDRTVTVALYQGNTPSLGGTLLGTFDFSSALADNNTLGGGSFSSPIALTAGTTYFVAFENVGPKSGAPNVDDLGVNFTADAGATNVGSTFYDGAGTGCAALTFACVDPNGDVLSQPILAFYGPSRAVPEPSTWALSILGFLGLGAMLRKRRTAADAVA